MRAKKDPKTGKWYIRFRYTDWQGKRRETMKRGFETKHDAEEWLRTFLSEQKADLNITFADFTDMYFKEKTSSRGFSRKDGLNYKLYWYG